MQYVRRMYKLNGRQNVIEDDLDCFLGLTCQSSTFNDRSQICFLTLHDEENILQLFELFLLFRYYNIIQFWDECALVLFGDSSHDLYLSEYFDEAVVVISKIIDMFDGNHLFWVTTSGFIYLAKAALINPFDYLIILEHIFPAFIRGQSLWQLLLILRTMNLSLSGLSRIHEFILLGFTVFQLLVGRCLR